MPPPELPRDAPGLDIVEPVEIGLGPVGGDEIGAPIGHRRARGLGQLLGIHEPLVGQHRLDHDIRAIPEGLHDLLVFDARGFLARLIVSVHHHQAERDDVLHHRLARVKPVHADIFFRHGAVYVGHARLLIHEAQHGQPMALGDLIVVEIMRAGDLYRAGAEVRVGILIGNDRDQAFGQRQAHQFADNRFVTRIIRVHRHRAVAEHGFRARRGNRDPVALLFEDNIPVLILLDIGVGLPAFERVFEVPHSPIDFAVLDFEIGNRGLEMRVPVDQPLVAIDEALIIERHEDLLHGLAQSLIHGEALARPVGGDAEPLVLTDNRAAGFFLPGPDTFGEFFPCEIGTLLLLQREIALDHHLRRDAGMVGARLPEHILAAHPLEPDQHILEGMVQRMAHMQDAGDIRRRDHDAIGLGSRVHARLETAGILPRLVEARFGVSRVETRVQHGAGDSQKSRGRPPSISAR